LGVIGLLAQSIIMAWAARRVGSSRGTFKFGLIAAVLITIAGWATMFLQMALKPAPDDPAQMWRLDPAVVQQHQTQAMAISLIVGILIWLVGFIIMMLVFKLSVKRTFSPFGAMLGFGVIGFLFVWFVLRPYVCEGFIVPTGSMLPTIEPQDRVVAEKLLSPRRFDLVVYHAPQHDSPVYVKRLIGLPGERLRFDGGDLYINDQKVPVPDVIAGKYRATVGSAPSNSDLYRDGQAIQLGSDDYFFLGDHTEVSIDSRMQGPSPKSSIVGVVDAIYWPVRKMKIIR